MLNGVVASDAGVSANTITVSPRFFHIVVPQVSNAFTLSQAPEGIQNRMLHPSSLSAKLILQNLGTIAAKGTAKVMFTIMFGGSIPTSFGNTRKIALNLGAGKTKKIVIPGLPNLMMSYPPDTNMIVDVNLLGDEVTTMLNLPGDEVTAVLKLA